jgi:hypothetical protein
MATDTQPSSEKVFHGLPCIETSAEVWAVIQARHSDQLTVYSSFSDPSGGLMGGGVHGRMETVYAVAGADYPLIGARSTWDITDEGGRENKRHDYFLMIPRNVPEVASE